MPKEDIPQPAESNGGMKAKTARSAGGNSGLFNSSVEKGLSVLQAFHSGRSHLTLTQVAAATGLEKSAAQRFTATLVSLGYLRKDPGTRQYSLTSRVLQLGASYMRSHPLIERADPYMLEWNRQYKETVSLGEMEGLDVVFIMRLRSRHVVTPNIVTGSTFPWYISALGQVIVAFKSPEEREQILDQTRPVAHASRTLVERRDLIARLETIRRDRFCITQHESYETEISLAAPVFGPSGEIVAGIGTAVLSTQWEVEEARKRLAPAIMELANAISSSRQMVRPEED